MTDNLIGRVCILDQSNCPLVLNWKLRSFIIPAPDPLREKRYKGKNCWDCVEGGLGRCRVDGNI